MFLFLTLFQVLANREGLSKSQIKWGFAIISEACQRIWTMQAVSTCQPESPLDSEETHSNSKLNKSSEVNYHSRAFFSLYCFETGCVETYYKILGREPEILAPGFFACQLVSPFTSFISINFISIAHSKMYSVGFLQSESRENIRDC